MIAGHNQLHIIHNTTKKMRSPHLFLFIVATINKDVMYNIIENKIRADYSKGVFTTHSHSLVKYLKDNP